MSMKLTPYQKLLVMAKDAVTATLAPVRAKSARKQAELELCKIEERIATIEAEITEASSKYPVCFPSITNKLDELDLAIRNKGQFEKIIAEMFPE